jgi:hypothetical protein
VRYLAVGDVKRRADQAHGSARKTGDNLTATANYTHRPIAAQDLMLNVEGFLSLQGAL